MNWKTSPGFMFPLLNELSLAVTVWAAWSLFVHTIVLLTPSTTVTTSGLYPRLPGVDAPAVIETFT